MCGEVTHESLPPPLPLPLLLAASLQRVPELNLRGQPSSHTAPPKQYGTLSFSEEETPSSQGKIMALVCLRLNRV